MLIFLILLAFRFAQNITSSSIIYKIGDFGFESNSTYYIKFTDAGSDNLIFCFFSEKEFSKYPLNQIPINQVCQSNSNFPKIRYKIFLSKIPYEINGTISNSSVYSQVVVNCENSDYLPVPIKLSLSGIFQNPSSNLDSRWKGINTIKFVIIIIFSSALLIWFIYFIANYKKISKLQALISCLFVFYLLSCIFRTLEIIQLENYDQDKGLSLTRRIIGFFQIFLLFLSILLISKGWCIIVNHISQEIFYYVFVVLVFDSMIFLIDLGNLSSFNITFLVISIFSACLIFHKIIISLNEVRQYLLSKMLSIINTTDYKMAEVNRMRTKYVSLETVVILFAFLYAAFSIITTFVRISFSICEAVYDSLQTLFLIILMILFKDHQFDLSSGYASVNAAFSLTDITPLDNIETHEVIEDDTIPAVT